MHCRRSGSKASNNSAGTVSSTANNRAGATRSDYLPASAPTEAKGCCIKGGNMSSSHSMDLSLRNASVVFSNRPRGQQPPAVFLDDPDFTMPYLAVASGWAFTLRCLRYLLFKDCLHQGG